MARRATLFGSFFVFRTWCFVWINVVKVHICATVNPLCLLGISHFVLKKAASLLSSN